MTIHRLLMYYKILNLGNSEYTKDKTRQLFIVSKVLQLKERKFKYLKLMEH